MVGLYDLKIQMNERKYTESKYAEKIEKRFTVIVPKNFINIPVTMSGEKPKISIVSIQKILVVKAVKVLLIALI